MLQTVTAIVALVLSALALSVSATTAWLTLWRRGQLMMTRPTMIAFVHEGESPKIVIRSMLFSTAHRGNVIESMKASRADRYGSSPTGKRSGSMRLVSRARYPASPAYDSDSHPAWPIPRPTATASPGRPLDGKATLRATNTPARM